MVNLCFTSAAMHDLSPQLQFLVIFALIGAKASRPAIAAVLLISSGVGLATVTDILQVSTNGIMGVLVGVGAVVSSALYQVFAGKDL